MINGATDLENIRHLSMLKSRFLGLWFLSSLAVGFSLGLALAETLMGDPIWGFLYAIISCMFVFIWDISRQKYLFFSDIIFKIWEDNFKLGDDIGSP